MQLSYLRKIYSSNIHLIKPKNLYAYFFVKGTRSPFSRVFFFGKAYYTIHKSAKINIVKGHLSVNRYIVKKDPFIGNLEMFKNAEINVGDDFFIHSGCDVMVFEGAKLNLGSGYINRYCKIRCYEEITIGQEVAISENFTIWDNDAHIIDGNKSKMKSPIVIGDRVWIGANVTILKGITIGNGAIIAAGSLVNKNVPEGCLVGGVPAKVLKENVTWR